MRERGALGETLRRRLGNAPPPPNFGPAALSHFVGFERSTHNIHSHQRPITPLALHSNHVNHSPARPLYTLPSMDSESEHDHRDDESVSEQEEIEDTKPKKSAMKQRKEVAAPVERPALPYVLSRLRTGVC